MEKSGGGLRSHRNVEACSQDTHAPTGNAAVCGLPGWPVVALKGGRGHLAGLAPPAHTQRQGAKQTGAGHLSGGGAEERDCQAGRGSVAGRARVHKSLLVFLSLGRQDWFQKGLSPTGARPTLLHTDGTGLLAYGRTSYRQRE